MQADQKPVIWTIVIVAIVLAIIMLGGVSYAGNKIDKGLEVMNTKLEGFSIDEQAMATNIANGIVAGIDIPSFEAPTYPEFPEYMINEDEYEENLIEDEAEKLALAELNSKDFMEALLIAINDAIPLTLNVNEQKGLEIESYKDIEDAYSVDVDDVVINVSAATGVVTIDFKVQYVLDDDEDLVGKARVTIVYDVYDLVVDDDFEDAEVEEVIDTDFDVTHLYTNLI